MNKKIIKKILELIIVLVGVTLIAFLLIYLSPGDPAEAMLAGEGNIPTKELLEKTREDLGLNKPVVIQYLDWLKKVLTGDLGYSYSMKVPVIEKLIETFFITFKLTISSLILMLGISLPLGFISALYKNKKRDYLIRGITFLGISIPSFWIGLVLLKIFGVNLRWIPVAGGSSDLKSLILPTITLGITMSAKYIRQIRTIVLEELNQEYVLGAKVRGLSDMKIILKEILPNVMLPVITLLGLSFGSLLSGVAIIEIVYNYPGMGSMIVRAIVAHDYPMIQAYVLVVALFYILVNMLVDTLYKKIDPRLRRGR